MDVQFWHCMALVGKSNVAKWLLYSQFLLQPDCYPLQTKNYGLSCSPGELMGGNQGKTLLVGP